MLNLLWFEDKSAPFYALGASSGSNVSSLKGLCLWLLCFVGMMPWPAVAQVSATGTTLSLTYAGANAASIAPGTVVTLTATVLTTPGGAPVARGQVVFCDAGAVACVDVHQLGVAQITSAGTALLRLHPAAGGHSYKAMFLGTPQASGSSSAPQSVTVNGIATKTTLASTGTGESYTLTATVLGAADPSTPSGSISFIDTSSNDAVLATVPLASSNTTLALVASPAKATIGLQPASIAVADFNGDGRLDSAVANRGFVGVVSPITVLLGEGDGTFTPAASPSDGMGADTIVTADFNGDGIPDLATAYTNSTDVTILLGKGDGTFTTATRPANPPALPVAGAPAYLAVADFNRDGLPDLAVTNPADNSITILLGAGDGTFQPSPATQSTGSAPFFVTTADFNADGAPDLAVLNNDAGTNTVTIYLGDGEGSFTLVTTGPGTGSGADAISIGDFDGDGIPDLVLGTSDTPCNFNAACNVHLAVLSGKGDGTFSAGTKVTYSTPSGGPIAFLLTGDFNHDGHADVAVLHSNNGRLGSPNMPGIALGDGQGNLAPPGVTAVAGTSPSPTAMGDFDGDGVPDLIGIDNGQATPDIPGTLNVLSSSNQTIVSVGDIAPPGDNANRTTASYTGDTLYQASVSAPVAVTPDRPAAAATIALESSANPTHYGSPVTLTAIVTGNKSTAPTGGVTFKDGDGQLGFVALMGDTATYATSALPVGSHTITVSYAGDSIYPKAASSALNLVVQKGAPAITIKPSATSVDTTQSLTVQVLVTGAAGAVAPQGAVVLSSGSYLSASTPLSGSSASFTIPAGALSAGTNTLLASYAPSMSSAETYIPASQSTPVTVVKIGTGASTTTAAPSAASITNQQGVTLAISVMGSAQAAPTGVVTISSGSYQSMQPLSNGTASFTIPAGTLADGVNTLTASYSGDSLYAPSQGSTTVTVQPAVLLVSAPVPMGESATAAITVETSSTYSGTLNVTCKLSSSPANAQSLPTCSLSPASLAITAGQPGKTTLTIHTTDAITALLRPRDLFRMGEEMAFAGLMLVFWPARRYRLPRLTLAATLACFVLLGCGGSSTKDSSSPSTPPTSAGSYGFTVTATDAANPSISTASTVTIRVR